MIKKYNYAKLQSPLGDASWLCGVPLNTARSLFGAFLEGKMIEQNVTVSFGAKEGVPANTARAAIKKAAERFKVPARCGCQHEICQKGKLLKVWKRRFLRDIDKGVFSELNICAVTWLWPLFLPELQVRAVCSIFSSDAFLPWQEKPEGFETIYREGEFQLRIIPDVPMQLICKPEYKSVKLCMDVGERFSYDEYRQIFLDATNIVAGVIEVTHAARSALIATRKDPFDRNYVRRTFGDLSKKIGAILPLSATE